MKIEARARARPRAVDVLSVSLTTILTLSLLSLLSSCGRGEQPAVSNAASPLSRIAGSAAESHPRVETALVELGSGIGNIRDVIPFSRTPGSAEF